MAGALASTPGNSLAMAEASFSVSVLRLPEPSRTPLLVTAPGITIIRFEPRLFSCSATFSLAPSPTASIVITAATPMMMPSAVSALRSLLARSERNAERAVSSRFMRFVWPASAPG